MLKLMLLRHAKAIHSAQYDDFDRPLVVKGREGAALVGNYIASKHYQPERALVSSAQRTRETWEIVKDYTGRTSPIFDRELYLASPATLLAAIHETEVRHVSTLLVIAHNPGIACLATALAGSGDDTLRQEMNSKFPTSALAVIAFDAGAWNELKPGNGVLEHFVYPKRLG